MAKTNARFDSHVRARRALARRVIARRLDWSMGADPLRAVLRAANWDADALLPAAYAAIGGFKWRTGWGDKLSTYSSFGSAQSVVGTYRDVPADVVHQIMCRMKDQQIADAKPTPAPLSAFEQEAERVRAAIATFPAVFGLRAFPGKRFVISESASMFCGEGLVYVALENGGAFAKGTPAELRAGVVALPVEYEADWQRKHGGPDLRGSEEKTLRVAQEIAQGTIYIAAIDDAPAAARVPGPEILGTVEYERRTKLAVSFTEGEALNLLHALEVLREDFSVQRRDSSRADIQAQCNRKVEELDALRAKIRPLVEELGWCVDDSSEF